MFRLVDRHNREFCLGPTHEEIITDLVRNEVRSYKQLPFNFCQINVILITIDFIQFNNFRIRK